MIVDIKGWSHCLEGFYILNLLEITHLICVLSLGEVYDLLLTGFNIAQEISLFSTILSCSSLEDVIVTSIIQQISALTDSWLGFSFFN